MTGQPAAKAGPTLRRASIKGKFHGGMAPTTPIGQRSTRWRLPDACCGTTRPYARSPSAANQRRWSILSATSARLCANGLPFSSVMVRAISSRRRASTSAIRSRYSPRSLGLSCRHDGQAAAASAMACLTAARSMVPTRASNSPVAGLWTGNGLRGSAQRPFRYAEWRISELSDINCWPVAMVLGMRTAKAGARRGEHRVVQRPLAAAARLYQISATCDGLPP